MTDIKTMTASNKLFGAIDSINNEFYKFIDTKNIIISNIKDIQRLEVKFEITLKEIIKLLDADNSYEKPIKILIKARTIIDFHGRFAEKHNIDLLQMIDILGSYNKKHFSWALDNLK